MTFQELNILGVERRCGTLNTNLYSKSGRSFERIAYINISIISSGKNTMYVVSYVYIHIHTYTKFLLFTQSYENCAKYIVKNTISDKILGFCL